MAQDPRPVLVTGANGQIALQLFAQLAQLDIPGRAVVRSERAAERIGVLAEGVRPEVEILDYADAAALTQAAAGCRAIVHLVGILKEGSNSSYRKAHEESCTAIAAAAEVQKVDRIVYLSIFGSRPDSTNACLASKGRAEAILMNSGTPTTVLRVPMVVGPDDPASRALRAQATKTTLPLTGGGETIHQPLDIRDLLAAIIAALADDSRDSHALDLGGPEALSYRALVERVAALFGNRVRVIKLPVGLMMALAGLLEKISRDPPITRAMLGVLEHDDRIDNASALEQLGVELTPLEQTLARYVGPQTGAP
ncbi:MAG: NAD(P)H-binding protein [bacterium]|nr:NAD(P)H-binding protein [bacterium]